MAHALDLVAVMAASTAQHGGQFTTYGKQAGFGTCL